MEQLLTPDRRYIIVKGRLWRAANPNLSSEIREALVSSLMKARREVRAATRVCDAERLAIARAGVNKAKVALGERGPAWWNDGAKDFNRYLIKNTPYAEWYRSTES